MVKEMEVVKPEAKFIILLAVSLLAIITLTGKFSGRYERNLNQVETPAITPTPTPTPLPTKTPIPTPDAKVVGPCYTVPILMYHHIEPQEIAQSKHQTALNVTPEVFDSHINYLIGRGYVIIPLSDLVSKLKGQKEIPGKSVVLTFDDAYQDFFDYAFPILQKYVVPASVFVPTGLVGNPDYMNWDEIRGIAQSGHVKFYDHTWSHKNLVGKKDEEIRSEILIGKTQLEERGLGNVNIFAYPYGGVTPQVEKILKEFGFDAAVTTIPGNMQCVKIPYDMRRIRIGNIPLAKFGF